MTAAELRPWFQPLDKTQEKAVQAIARADVTILLGGAGSGKTHVAVACALNAVALSQTKRIFLTRPNVTVGRDLGYLPGELDEKLGPWMEPIRDVLSQMSFVDFNALPFENVALQHVRGRSFTEAYGLLDEAQNLTEVELTAYLTRLGRAGKLILCGDVDQCDIYNSALWDVSERLRGLAKVETVWLRGQHRNPTITAMLKRLEETRNE